MTLAQSIRLHLYLRRLRYTFLIAGTTAVVVFVVGAVVALAASSGP